MTTKTGLGDIAERIAEAQRAVKESEGYAGLAAMHETACAEYMPQDALDEMERIFNGAPSTFIDADDSEAVAGEQVFSAVKDGDRVYPIDDERCKPLEVVTFDNLDDYIDATHQFPTEQRRAIKALIHESMVVSERAKRVCRQVIDRCREALRYRCHADTKTLCDILDRIEREVWQQDQRMKAHHLKACYAYCSDTVERAHDILDALMSRDERWQMEDARRNVPHVTFAEKRMSKHYKPMPFQTCTMIKGAQRQIVATAVRAQFLAHQGWRTEVNA